MRSVECRKTLNSRYLQRFREVALLVHNKIVVADDAVITGSYNLSNSATENAENLLIIDDASLAEEYGAYIDGLVKRYGPAPTA